MKPFKKDHLIAPSKSTLLTQAVPPQRRHLNNRMILRGHYFSNDNQKTWTIFLLEEISIIIYTMSRFEKLTIEELKVIAKPRSIDGRENMSKQHLEGIFTPASKPKPKPKPASKPKKFIISLKSK